MSTDTIRQEREDRLDSKLYRLRQRADSLERRAAVLCAEFESHRGDWIRATQPANAGRRLAKQRRSEVDRYNRGQALYAEARELRERADLLERRGVSVAGDKEAKRQKLRDYQDSRISIGTVVEDVNGDQGKVIRVNKLTYRVRYPNGRQSTHEKYLVKLVDRGEESV